VERWPDIFTPKHLHAFMMAASSQVRSLHIGADSLLELPLLIMLRTYPGLPKFPNLERLSIVSNFSEWLPLLGHNLKSLWLQQVEKGFQ